MSISIPAGVYFDIQRDNFFDRDGDPCGTVFYRCWKPRWNEFPTERGGTTPEYRYAVRLAEYLWEKQGGKQDAPHWRPLPDLMSVLSQIDNMIAGYNWKK